MADSDDDELLLMVKFKVAVYIQPELFNEVHVYIPDPVYVTLLHDQLYESQAVADSVDVELLLMIKFKVAVFTQAELFNVVQS